MLILGIESSCDETAAAVLDDNRRLLSSVINSQIDIHARYGGVVPELASRQHIRNIYLVVQQALSEAGVTLPEIDGLAVTEGPGLVGCLLVGHTFCKAISLALKKPMVGVDHLNGHLLSVFLGPEPPEFPYVAMVASGGHSSLFLVNDHHDFKLLGRTRDDAAGEAFDKVAKLLDLGYPGGPVVSRIAKEGDPSAIEFPRALLGPDNLDFSFSGLKTSVANYLNSRNQKNLPVNTNDICASFQEAIVEVITEKSIRACRQTGCENLVLAGGVAANHRLRKSLADRCATENIRLYLTPIEYCTDNAAMIALAGYFNFADRASVAPDSDVYSRSTIFQT
ncbi:MAG: tRNA (adenosine(37)-N6)-threonylcarbamoyltransferase complex transferase subunit TsaD [Proteobacteria bacterium]|nr:tRNA (adenosine(37)-N6)-threonylcarbamoyltransferase complex transferase subunit TsaD [Pseudomonadota bacterium]MBU1738739.1 tRNA (adenosine(37)-N6)-threonylcarbamoyltransferase complex transferase subunit TsaD [Pseudomonadota bacterium]